MYVCVQMCVGFPLESIFFLNHTTLPSGYPAAPCQTTSSVPSTGGRGCWAPCLGSDCASHWPKRGEQLSHW